MKTWLNIISLILLSLFYPTQSHAAATQYPVILIHGFMGFDDAFGIDYFYGIPEALSNQGVQVFVARVSPVNTTEIRGEQLRLYVQSVLAYTGAEKVNLIGHSHGGPTARYVASVSPEIVASVTSIGGVNWGSRFADFLMEKIPVDSALAWVLNNAFNTLSEIITRVSGGGQYPTGTLASTASLTTQGSIIFNQKYPEGIPEYYCGYGSEKASNGVSYYSWSGTSQNTHVLDPSDVAFNVISRLFDEPNDGLVSSCSSHLGKVLSDNYNMNHLDQINQMFGLVSWSETNPKILFKEHINLLANNGF
ncbi:triacylglycerol lipase [Shewanella sp. VB17]|uniref:esterase/lipase family protein n=1 Tax=Shewanella sp. VB17 TaxID=2739432 RepID=UPI0015649E84|nr:triacylglycerol lipase [Shewanella sp. VB17]NRD73386.1 triacylglycerol lipase [Shewanella sp. VB17]